MFSLQSVLDLLNSATTVASRIVLDRELKQDEQGFEWMMFRPFFPWKNTPPLTVARSGREIHIHRDEVDILRRTKDGLWEFEPQSSIPVFYQDPCMSIPGLTRYFIDFPTWLSELGNFDASTVSEGEIAGRTALIIPLGDLVISIDLAHGVVLAAENSTEKVFATDIEFLTSWQSPQWTGDISLPETTTPEPGDQRDLEADLEADEESRLQPVVLPPMPLASRNLRVLCTWHAMEGFVPEWKPGDNVSLFLSFNMDEAPLEGLETTRRGFLEPRELHADYRSYGFHADGWNALINTETPLHREEELTGYFTHCTYLDFDIPTYAVVTAVNRNGADTIIDVTLDGAVPPQFPVPTGGEGSSTSDGETFWITETGLPYVKGFSVDSGQLTHAISIPCWENIKLIDGNIAKGADKRWSLPSLKEVSVTLPEAPEGWRILRSFNDNLYSLVQTVDSPVDTYLRQAVIQSDPYRFIELDLGFHLIDDAFRYGDHIYVRTHHHFIMFNNDLEILELETQGSQAALYTPLVDFPLGTAAQQARRTGSLTLFRPEEDVYAFHHPETTEQITTFRRTNVRGSDIVHATVDKIIIALRNPNDHMVESMSVWDPENGWRTQKLEL